MLVLRGSVKPREGVTARKLEQAVGAIPGRQDYGVRPIPHTGLVDVAIVLDDPSLSWESARSRVWAHVQALVEDATPIATVGSL